MLWRVGVTELQIGIAKAETFDLLTSRVPSRDRFDWRDLEGTKSAQYFISIRQLPSLTFFLLRIRWMKLIKCLNSLLLSNDTVLGFQTIFLLQCIERYWYVLREESHFPTDVIATRILQRKIRFNMFCMTCLRYSQVRICMVKFWPECDFV